MPNDECLMTKETRNPNDKKDAHTPSWASCFVINSAFVIRASSFLRIRRSPFRYDNKADADGN